MKLLVKLGAVTSTLLAAPVVVYFAAGGVPSLIPPVRVFDAAYLADGGSFHLILQDAAGSKFVVSAQGSLDRPRRDFPIYTQRWWPYFPVPFYVLHGSSTEKQLSHSLERWSSDDSLPVRERQDLQHAAQLLRDRKE